MLPDKSILTYTFGRFNNALAAAGDDNNYWEIRSIQNKLLHIKKVTSFFWAQEAITNSFWSPHNALSLTINNLLQIAELPWGRRTGLPPDVTAGFAGTGAPGMSDVELPLYIPVTFENLYSSIGFRFTFDTANAGANAIYYKQIIWVELQFLDA